MGPEELSIFEALVDLDRDGTLNVLLDNLMLYLCIFLYWVSTSLSTYFRSYLRIVPACNRGHDNHFIVCTVSLKHRTTGTVNDISPGHIILATDQLVFVSSIRHGILKLPIWNLWFELAGYRTWDLQDKEWMLYHKGSVAGSLPIYTQSFLWNTAADILFCLNLSVYVLNNTLASYGQISHHFDFLRLSYHNQCGKLNRQIQLQLLMINTKIDAPCDLQVCNTCIAWSNSKIVLFLISSSCNWIWQLNLPHWLWE